MPLNNDNMTIAELIAILAVLVEVFLLLWIVGVYLSKKNQIADVLEVQKFQNIYDLISNDEKKNEWLTAGELDIKYWWIVQLIRKIGKGAFPSEIEEIIFNNLSKSNPQLRYLTNLAPAIGLVATFLGMFLTTQNLTNQLDLNSIPLMMTNLYPIFIGGASGIIVFMIGILLLKSLEWQQLEATQRLMSYYFSFESLHAGIEPESEKEVYEATREVYKKLLSQMRSVSTKMDEAHGKYDGLVEQSKLLIDKFSSSFTVIEQSSNGLLKYNDFINSSAERWEQASKGLQSLAGIISAAEANMNSLSAIAVSMKEASVSISTQTSVWSQVSESVKTVSQEFVAAQKSLENLSSISYSLKVSATGIIGNAKSTIAISENIKVLAESFTKAQHELDQLTSIADSIQTVAGGIQDQNTRMDLFIGGVEQEKLEFRSTRASLEEFDTSVEKFQNNVEVFKNGVLSIRDDVNENLTKIGKEAVEHLGIVLKSEIGEAVKSIQFDAKGKTNNQAPGEVMHPQNVQLERLVVQMSRLNKNFENIENRRISNRFKRLLRISNIENNA